MIQQILDYETKPLTQLDRVEAVMDCGRWLAFHDIARLIMASFHQRDSETGISARLRELRKKGHVIEKRVRKGYRRLREYRMVTS